MQVTIKDSLWSYFAQFLSIGWGIILLPVVLNRLSTEEVAVYYILLTLSSLITVFDFGFSPQFSRNISYVFAGIKELKKEGINDFSNDTIDFILLSKLIRTAEYIYNRIAIYVFLFLLFGGTSYLYIVTDGFSFIPDILFVWLLYLIVSYIKMRYLFYNSLLTGKGCISYYQKIVVIYRVIYLLIAVVLLFCGFKLLSIVLADFIAIIIQRYLAKRGFYSKDIKNKIILTSIAKNEISSMFELLWYNAKKLGATSISGFLVSYSGFFFVGIYLSLEDIASYGLLTQLVNALGSISSCLITIHLPFFAYCRAKKMYQNIINRFSLLIIIFYFIFIIGIVTLLMIIPVFLKYIQSSSILPSFLIILIYSIVRLLEFNHSNFAILLTSNNKIPYMKAAIISGFFTLVGLVLVLNFTNLKLLGVVLVPGIVQGVYQNWKWPQEVCKEYHISFLSLVKIGIENIFQEVKIVRVK